VFGCKNIVAIENIPQYLNIQSIHQTNKFTATYSEKLIQAFF